MKNTSEDERALIKITTHEREQNLLGGKFVWTDTFVKQHGEWKMVASQVTPVLEK
jgi:hypothetical protein